MIEKKQRKADESADGGQKEVKENNATLKIDKITKHYGSFDLNCSLSVEPGRITGLIGKNGAGKSTTFKAILGLIKPDGGQMELFGKRVEELSAADKQKLGVVLSEAGFSGYLTLQSIQKVLASLYDAFDLAYFEELCERFQLPRNQKLKGFSTGMKVKVKILAAVTHGARLLILDEPTAGLDVVAREELLTLLREYMEEDEERSVLISSHISGDLEHLCDDVYMIQEGRILLHEDTDVLLDEYGILKVDREQYMNLDKRYLLYVKEESYGCCCLTNQRQFYLENAPRAVMEKSGLDDLIKMIIQGERV